MWTIYLPINDGDDDQKDFLGGQITFFVATIFFDTNPLFGANPPLHTDQGALTFPNKTSSEVKHCQLLQMELCVNLSSPSALRRAGYTHRAMQTGKHHVNWLYLYLIIVYLFVFVFTQGQPHTSIEHQCKLENVASPWFLSAFICLWIQTYNEMLK